MTDTQNWDIEQHSEQQPRWRKAERESRHSLEQYSQDEHMWEAIFYESGRLAYWKCEACGIADRDTELLPERLEMVSGWVNNLMKLTASGPQIPTSTRRWATTRDTILFEGDPSSILFAGIEIPDIPEAHTYIERDQHGQILSVFQPTFEKDSPYGNHYTLTRYQVVGSDLIYYESYCFEESTFDTPFAGKPKQQVVFSKLEERNS
jgi:hypothetical protein